MSRQPFCQVTDDWIADVDAALLRGERMAQQFDQLQRHMHASLKSVPSDEVVIAASADGERFTATYYVRVWMFRRIYGQAEGDSPQEALTQLDIKLQLKTLGSILGFAAKQEQP